MRSMFQRFSIASLLLVIAVLAVASFVLRQAALGQLWAMAVAMVLGAALAWLVTHMLLGIAGYLVMKVRQQLTPRTAQSPFATDVPAPQILPPKHFESE